MEDPAGGYRVRCDCGQIFYVDTKDEDELRERLKTYHQAFHNEGDTPDS